MTREQVYIEARRWLGVKFHNQGRSERGVDCVGLLAVVAQAFGIEEPALGAYSDWPRSDHFLLRRMGEHLVRVPPSAAKPGLIGAFTQSKLPGHTGIFSLRHGQVHLIHARIIPRRVVEEPWAAVPMSELRLIALYAYPGLEDL
jgi:hypothetical protein